jgi:hypothetical protein
MTAPTGLEMMSTLAGESRDHLATAVTEAPTQETASSVSAVVQALHDVDSAVDDARQRVEQVRADSSIGLPARLAAVAETLAEANVTVLARLGTATSFGDQTIAALTAATLPQRPAGDVAAQETQLANLRTDLRMTLDATSADNLPDRLGQLLDSAVARGDELASWFLGSTSWTEEYLGTRSDATLAATRWSEMVRPAALARRSGPDLDSTRQTLTALTGPKGLTTALIAQRDAARFALDDLTHGR